MIYFYFLVYERYGTHYQRHKIRPRDFDEYASFRSPCVIKQHFGNYVVCVPVCQPVCPCVCVCQHDNSKTKPARGIKIWYMAFKTKLYRCINFWTRFVICLTVFANVITQKRNETEEWNVTYGPYSKIWIKSDKKKYLCASVCICVCRCWGNITELR